jgi:hypothetical protein
LGGSSTVTLDNTVAGAIDGKEGNQVFSSDMSHPGTLIGSSAVNLDRTVAGAGGSNKRDFGVSGEAGIAKRLKH